MEHLKFKHDSVVLIMIILILLIFLKAILYFISLINYKHPLISNEHFEKFRNMLNTFLDIVLILISLVILFLRKNNSLLAIFLAIIILFKAFLDLFLSYDFYKYSNLSDNAIKNLNNYKIRSVFISNIVLFIATIYMLKIIFAI